MYFNLNFNLSQKQHVRNNKKNTIVKSKILFHQMQFYYFLSVLSGVSLMLNFEC